MAENIRKPRVKLVEIGESFREDGAWRKFFGDSRGRVYLRIRRNGWKEIWHLVMRVGVAPASEKETLTCEH